jgi:acetoin utilization protein AcuB
MLVRDKMSRFPITTQPDASVPDALKIMQGSKVRQLPVLDDKGELVGIVSLTDLFRALPSPASSLSQWEVDYLLDKIKVETVMTREVVTVAEDTAVEEAGRLLVDRKISGLPVMRDGELVGMITESDLFGILMDVFGARQSGVRVTARMPLVKGGLAKLSAAIAETGGHFVAFAESMELGTVTFKVDDVDEATLLKAIKPIVDEVVDVRGA